MAEKLNRRSLLAALGASSTVGTGNVIARSDEQSKIDDEDAGKDILEKYDTEAAAAKAIENYGKPYLRYIEEDEHDVIDTSSVSLFTNGELLTDSEFLNGESGIFVSSVKFDNFGWTPRITARHENEDYIIKIYVKPELEEAHAAVEKKYMEDVKVLLTFANGSVDASSGDTVIAQEDLNGGAGGCDCCYIGDYCTTRASYSCPGDHNYHQHEIWECEDGSCLYGDRTGCCDPRYVEDYDCDGDK